MSTVTPAAVLHVSGLRDATEKRSWSTDLGNRPDVLAVEADAVDQRDAPQIGGAPTPP